MAGLRFLKRNLPCWFAGLVAVCVFVGLGSNLLMEGSGPALGLSGYWGSVMDDREGGQDRPVSSGRISAEASETPCMDQVAQARSVNYTGLCDVISFLKALNQYGEASGRPLPIHLLQGCHQIFFNRIPKTGSRTAHDVMVAMGEVHNYSVKRKAKGMGRNPSGRSHKVDAYVDAMSRHPEPIVVIKHVYFIDFVRRMEKPMVMLNLMREPVDQAISLYSWLKYGDVGTEWAEDAKDRMTLDECVEEFGPDRSCFFWQMTAMPFFCGPEDDNCWDARQPTLKMLQKAKLNVENTYLLVGIMDDFPAFFEGLEALLPHFFCNVTSVYDAMARDMYELYKTSQRETISEKTMVKLRQHLRYNIELYQFVRQRFYETMAKVRRHKALLGSP